MKYLELTLSTPAANLAVDEWLLARCEETGEECLRVWESPTPFVVLGISNHVSEEVNVAICERLQVPITRRISGGGAVVQGPGCLSYALVLRIPEAGPLASITATNRHLMETQAVALAELLKQKVTVQGDTDLALNGRKISGNSQKRGRYALLFHGTILYRADIELFGSLLNHPAREPIWRQRRCHADFIANVRAERADVADCLRRIWSANVEFSERPDEGSLRPFTARHLDASWVDRFA